MRGREVSELAIASAQHSDYLERAALLEADQAAREAEFGNDAAARKDARAALGLAQGQEVRALTALALAHSGDREAAGRLADQLSAEFPLSLLMKNYWLPTIRAGIELEAGNPNLIARLRQDVINPALDAARKLEERKARVHRGFA